MAPSDMDRQEIANEIRSQRNADIEAGLRLRCEEPELLADLLEGLSFSLCQDLEDPRYVVMTMRFISTVHIMDEGRSYEDITKSSEGAQAAGDMVGFCDSFARSARAGAEAARSLEVPVEGEA